jgi:arginase
MSRMSRPISIIGAPTSAGAYAPGQEKAPAAFRRHGLAGGLSQNGCIVRDLGDTELFRWRPDPRRPHAANLEAVVRACRDVADKTAEVMSRGEQALVLGGDCTVELGVVAGAVRDGSATALVYIDHDVDLNTPAESDGALDWTGIAHLLGLDGCEPELMNLAGHHPMMGPRDVLFFAADNVTPAEAEKEKRLALPRISSAEVKRDPAAAGRQAAEWAGRHDRLLVHLDVDVLDFLDFPIAENTRRRNGLTLDELAQALKPLLSAPNFRALTITEVNPDHAPDEAASFGRLIGVVAMAMK